MKPNQAMQTKTTQFGPLQIAIVLLTLITAIIHLVVLNVRIAASGAPLPLGIPFILNGLGFLALLAALYLPLPFAKDNRRLVRWVFIGYTIVTILAWVPMGSRDAVGYLTKLDEVILAILLWREGQQSSSQK